MKKFIVTVLLCCTAATAAIAQAQDTLRHIDGGILLANVDSVGRYDVGYHYFKDEVLIRRKASKSVIASIAYADGRHDTLYTFEGKNISPTSPMLHAPNDVLYQMGRRDAKKYYSRYGGAYTGTILSTFPGSPLAGLIVGTACSLTPPKEKNLGIPNAALAQNTAYHDGYYKSARRIKNGKIWTGFGIGVLANVALFALLSSN